MCQYSVLNIIFNFIVNVFTLIFYACYYFLCIDSFLLNLFNIKDTQRLLYPSSMQSILLYRQIIYERLEPTTGNRQIFSGLYEILIDPVNFVFER